MNMVIKFIFTVIALLGIVIIAVVGWPFIWGLMLLGFANKNYSDDENDVFVYFGMIITALVLGVVGQIWWVIYMVDLLEKGLS